VIQIYQLYFDHSFARLDRAELEAFLAPFAKSSAGGALQVDYLAFGAALRERDTRLARRQQAAAGFSGSSLLQHGSASPPRQAQFERHASPVAHPVLQQAAAFDPWVFHGSTQPEMSHDTHGAGRVAASATAAATEPWAGGHEAARLLERARECHQSPGARGYSAVAGGVAAWSAQQLPSGRVAPFGVAQEQVCALLRALGCGLMLRRDRSPRTLP